MFKPWKIPKDIRGYTNKYAVPIRFEDPVKQIQIIENTISLTAEAYPKFYKETSKIVVGMSKDMAFGYVNNLIKHIVKESIAEAQIELNLSGKVWKTAVQNSLFSYGYKLRRWFVSGDRSAEDILGIEDTPFYFSNTILLEPRCFEQNDDMTGGKISTIGNIEFERPTLLPSLYNMCNLRLVRKFGKFGEETVSYELRCSEFISMKSLILYPEWQEKLKSANYSGTYVGGR